MKVMVIYVWQCMTVLLYDCICARWLWSIMNEDASERKENHKRKKCPQKDLNL